MSCALEVGRLARFDVKNYEGFASDVESLSKYVIERNSANVSAELTDADWREKQTHDLFEKMQSGARFSDLVLNHPLLQRLVERKGKNETNLTFIRDHIVPSFLNMALPVQDDNLTRWAIELNGACISPSNLEEQIQMLEKLPPEYATRLLEGKKTISMGLWKLALKGEFNHFDLLTIVNIIKEGLKSHTAAAYFSVCAMEAKITDEASKCALVYKLEGNPNPAQEFVAGSKLEVINELAELYHQYRGKNFIVREIIAPIIDGIGAKPSKDQLLRYFAFRYLVLINSNQPYQNIFFESTVLGLIKLSEDPKIKKT